MALTFTLSLGATEAGRADVHTMLIGAFGCNLAWGLIDAAMYLMGIRAERGLGASAVLGIRTAYSRGRLRGHQRASASGHSARTRHE